MRRTAALSLVAAAALATLAPAPANASLYCQDLGPVPGYGPVCTVRCILGHQSNIDPKDIRGTVISLVTIVCPA